MTETLCNSLPNACFGYYSSEVSGALAPYLYKDIDILISAEDIIGIEEDWLNANIALNGISLKGRSIFITPYDNKYLSPKWDALFVSYTNRGAMPSYLEIPHSRF